MSIPEFPEIAIRRKMEGGIHNFFGISPQQCFLFGSHVGNYRNYWRGMLESGQRLGMTSRGPSGNDDLRKISASARALWPLIVA